MASGEVAEKIRGISGGSGGASVETCTVTIDNQGTGSLQCIGATQYNGELASYYVNVPGTNTITIDNVVCGSVITFGHSTYFMLPVCSTTGGATLLGTSHHHWVFSAPTVANANATITVWDDD
jgi:hypothetical protein